MPKQKENLFLDKFHLLNSQEEHKEDISWTSSCSSGYEDANGFNKSNQVLKTLNRKRKRKKKAPKNISNLNITILDTSKESKTVLSEVKSPILISTSRQESVNLSPILQPTFKKKESSPIISYRCKNTYLNSPILTPKTISPKSAVKVCKKLFDKDVILTKVKEEIDSSIKSNQSIETKDGDHSVTENVSKAKLELVKQVKSFFDSHFSSENTSIASQNSISDIFTPKNSTETSDEVDIFTCKSPVLPNNSISIQSKQNNSIDSSENSQYNFNKNSKKVKYRKDGHAYRLNSLLKKQYASLSLWQHEKFLAEHSNFVIPKGEFTVFHIQKVNFKYGCHLLEASDVNNDKYIILINSCYVSNNIISDTIIKLYEPFRIVTRNNYKLIINVTKFECSSFKIE